MAVGASASACSGQARCPVARPRTPRRDDARRRSRRIARIASAGHPVSHVAGGRLAGGMVPMVAGRAGRHRPGDSLGPRAERVLARAASPRRLGPLARGPGLGHAHGGRRRFRRFCGRLAETPRDLARSESLSLADVPPRRPHGLYARRGSLGRVPAVVLLPGLVYGPRLDRPDRRARRVAMGGPPLDVDGRESRAPFVHARPPRAQRRPDGLDFHFFQRHGFPARLVAGRMEPVRFGH